MDTEIERLWCELFVLRVVRAIGVAKYDLLATSHDQVGLPDSQKYLSGRDILSTFQ